MVIVDKGCGAGLTKYISVASSIPTSHHVCCGLCKAVCDAYRFCISLGSSIRDDTLHDAPAPVSTLESVNRCGSLRALLMWVREQPKAISNQPSFRLLSPNITGGWGSIDSIYIYIYNVCYICMTCVVCIHATTFAI